MARRKNTKRIDPRYFLNETAYKDTLLLEKKLDGKYVPQVRVVAKDNSLGIPRGSGIVVTAGWDGTPENKFQVHVFQGGAREYKSIQDMIMRGQTGEGFYMTDEELLQVSQLDSAAAGKPLK